MLNLYAMKRLATVLGGVLCLALLMTGVSGAAPTQQDRDGLTLSDVTRLTQAQTPQPTGRWLVRFAAGTDVNAVANRLGYQAVGSVNSQPNSYLFSIPQSFGDEAAFQNTASRLNAAPEIVYFEPEMLLDIERHTAPSDPVYTSQWHLNNTGQFGGLPGADIRAEDAWGQNFTGQGVHVGIVDDGVEYNHPDLDGSKFIANRSFDYADTDFNIAPRYGTPGCPGQVEGGDDDCHGTSVAGLTVAEANNGVCGAGVAYNATYSGQRLVTGAPLTQFQIANALANASAVDTTPIDVSNNSWGPAASSIGFLPATVDTALAQGADNNTVYVWSVGNSDFAGQQEFGHGSRNPYADSRYTISVGATNNLGVKSAYSEESAALIVNAPSNGFTSDGSTASVYTTDLLGAGEGYGGAGNDCTNDFGGTSASAPIAAGVVALMKEANPSLTWRDVQHILIQSARRNDPGHFSWQQNGAGRWTSDFYGFGTIDAGAAVSLAQNWSGVEAYLNEDLPVQSVNQAIPDGTGAPFSYGAPVVRTYTFNASQIQQLEHVELQFNVDHAYSGDLQVILQSPSGTRSRLTDVTNAGPVNYNDTSGRLVMSNQFWGENPNGTWQIEVRDGWQTETGNWLDWQLKLYGTGAASVPPLAMFDAASNAFAVPNAANDAFVSRTATPPIAADSANQWVMGDWNADGVLTPGVFANGAFHLTNSSDGAGTWTSHWIGPNGQAIAGRLNRYTPNDCFGVMEQGNLGSLTVFALWYTCDFSTTTPNVTWHWVSAPLQGDAAFNGPYEFALGDWSGDGSATIAVRRNEYIAFSNIWIVNADAAAPQNPNNTYAEYTFAQYWGAPAAQTPAFFLGRDWDGVDGASFGVVYFDGANGNLIYRNNSDFNVPDNISTTFTSPFAPTHAVALRNGGVAALGSLPGASDLQSLGADAANQAPLAPLPLDAPIDDSPLQPIEFDAQQPSRGG